MTRGTRWRGRLGVRSLEFGVGIFLTRMRTCIFYLHLIKAASLSRVFTTRVGYDTNRILSAYLPSVSLAITRAGIVGSNSIWMFPNRPLNCSYPRPIPTQAISNAFPSMQAGDSRLVRADFSSSHLQRTSSSEGLSST